MNGIIYQFDQRRPAYLAAYVDAVKHEKCGSSPACWFVRYHGITISGPHRTKKEAIAEATKKIEKRYPCDAYTWDAILYHRIKNFGNAKFRDGDGKKYIVENGLTELAEDYQKRKARKS